MANYKDVVLTNNKDTTARKHYKEAALHKHPMDAAVVQYHKDHKEVVLE